jgi:hypothetical protein
LGLTPVSSGREWAPQCACACSIPPPPESTIKSSSPTTAATTDSCPSIRSSTVVQNRVVVQFLGPCYTSFRDTPSIPRPHLQSFFVSSRQSLVGSSRCGTKHPKPNPAFTLVAAPRRSKEKYQV